MFFRVFASVSLLQLAAVPLVIAEVEEPLDGFISTAACGQTRCAKIKPTTFNNAAPVTAGGGTQDVYNNLNYVFSSELNRLCQVCLKKQGNLPPSTAVYRQVDLACGGAGNEILIPTANSEPSQGPEYGVLPASFFSSNGGGVNGLNNYCFNNFDDYEDPCCVDPNAVSITSEYTTCFSSVATVEVEGKGKVSMKDVTVGDVVLTTSGFNKVYTIDHKEENRPTKFVQIHTETSVLELTANHLIYLYAKHDPIPAGSVSVGDEVMSFSKDDGRFQPSIVTRISSVTRKGFYNPITSSGTLIVDGLATSTYTAFQVSTEDSNNYLQVAGMNILSMHDFLHLVMGPIRSICTVASPKAICSLLDGEELAVYSKLGIKLQTFGQNQNRWIQSVLLVSLVTFFAFFSVVSNPLVIFSLLSVASLAVFQSKKHI